jgi:hypothetical protein
LINLSHVTAQVQYLQDRFVVVDDFFSKEALEEIWRYQLEAQIFQTMRAGYLGAFPANGNTHPLIKHAALQLEGKMPKVFLGHSLGLWWLFKYTNQAKNGISIHADAAAVNINIWLTPDSAHIKG